MVNSSSCHSAKQQTIWENLEQEAGEVIRDFLERELPPENNKQAAYLANVLLKAGARYDRYTARSNEWMDYANRRARLKGIAKAAERLASDLCELDMLSRDDLASRVDPKEIEALVGSLHFLSKEAADLAKEVQQNGRPRDLAEERWIAELADIYENAFGRPASVWGSGAGQVKRRGNFYSLLEVSRPTSFPRYGKLSLRQIERALIRRKKRQRAIILRINELSADRTEAARAGGECIDLGGGVRSDHACAE